MCNSPIVMIEIWFTRPHKFHYDSCNSTTVQQENILSGGVLIKSCAIWIGKMFLIQASCLYVWHFHHLWSVEDLWYLSWKQPVAVIFISFWSSDSDEYQGTLWADRHIFILIFLPPAVPTYTQEQTMNWTFKSKFSSAQKGCLI